MSISAIEHFMEYRFSLEELKKLPKDQQAIISLLCFAVSETNALARLYIFNGHAVVDEDAINSAASIQRFLLLRTWSSKLFEVKQCFSSMVGRKQTKDPEVIEAVRKALKKFDSIGDPNAHPIVQDIRNGLANHYSFKEAKRNLDHVKGSANCNFYMHEMNGNSFYPLGEEVMFMGLMNRHNAKKDTELTTDLLEAWMGWNLLANDWLAKTHVEFVVRFVLGEGEKMSVRKKSYWVPPQMVGTKDDRKAPLFVRTQK